MTFDNYHLCCHRAIAAPFAEYLGIRHKFITALTSAPQTVAFKICPSFPDAIKIKCPKKYAIENTKTKIDNICNISILGINAFPNKTGTIYSATPNIPITDGYCN